MDLLNIAVMTGREGSFDDKVDVGPYGYYPLRLHCPFTDSSSLTAQHSWINIELTNLKFEKLYTLCTKAGHNVQKEPAGLKKIHDGVKGHRLKSLGIDVTQRLQICFSIAGHSHDGEKYTCYELGLREGWTQELKI